MKKISSLFVLFFSLLGPLLSNAQETTLPDQNPQYAVSRARYMAIADSVNQWHSTTHQQTYKAYDWYEAREEKKRIRQQLEHQRRLNRGYYYHDYNGRHYRRNYYPSNYYRGYNHYPNNHCLLPWRLW